MQNNHLWVHQVNHATEDKRHARRAREPREEPMMIKWSISVAVLVLSVPGCFKSVFICVSVGYRCLQKCDHVYVLFIWRLLRSRLLLRDLEKPESAPQRSNSGG